MRRHLMSQDNVGLETPVQRATGFNLNHLSPSLRIPLILKRMTGRAFQFVLSSLVNFVNFRGEIRRLMIRRIRGVAGQTGFYIADLGMFFGHDLAVILVTGTASVFL